jgi:hypothetical protein
VRVSCPQGCTDGLCWASLLSPAAHSSGGRPNVRGAGSHRRVRLRPVGLYARNGAHQACKGSLGLSVTIPRADTRLPSPGAVGPGSRRKLYGTPRRGHSVPRPAKRRRYADAPAGALLTGLWAARVSRAAPKAKRGVAMLTLFGCLFPQWRMGSASYAHRSFSFGFSKGCGPPRAEGCAG